MSEIATDAIRQGRGFAVAGILDDELSSVGVPSNPLIGPAPVARHGIIVHTHLMNPSGTQRLHRSLRALAATSTSLKVAVATVEDSCYLSEVPDLKYAEKVRELKDCPPAQARECDLIAYRFVKVPLDGSSFIPAALEPGRFAGGIPCKAYGLSLFATEEQARAHFADILSRQPQAALRLGDHLASVRLNAAHGVQTVANTKGHITLHEYEKVNLVDASQVIGKL